jgi:hypothetical protein
MAEFRRAFNVDALRAWVAANEGNAVSALFDRWALPGEAAANGRMLRVAVRAGYLNFYVAGQSVAKLTMRRAGMPEIEVHNSYVTGLHRIEAKGKKRSQNYVKFVSDQLADPDTFALIDGWIAAASSYSSPEKMFVDDLVASTFGVIDLEMGLPVSKQPDAPKSAPRMDVVVVQDFGGEPQIAFWEAKCANNGELRASTEFSVLPDGSKTGPKVLHQLMKYISWMDGQNRVKQVQRAYVEAAKVLTALQRLFRSDVDEGSVALWRLLSESRVDDVVIIAVPRQRLCHRIAVDN